MEFLFMGQWASIEAILVLTCVGIFVAIFLYDGFLYLNRVFHIFVPKKESEIPTEPEPIGVLTAMPVIANHVEYPIAEESQEEKTEDTTESINNDDLIELNITGDADEGEEIESGEAQIESPTPETETPEVVETQEESTLVSQDSPEIQIIEEAPTETQEPVIESVVTETSVDDATSDKIEEVPMTPSEPEETTIEEESIEAEEEAVIETEEVAKKEKPPKTNHTETLFALTNNVRTLIARGQTLEARGLIIQGLALDKGHRELNMMLAGLYEQDRHFEKAEYIYKDLALEYPNDIEILEKLGNVLIIQRRYEIAIEMYKKILGLTGETEGTLYILTHLSNELGQHEVSYDYSKRYQKRWPNNPEILTIMAQNEIAIGNRKDAIQTLIKLKNLTPYNQEIADLIQKLVLEEELAGNFGGEK